VKTQITRTLIALILAATSLLAETVYFAPEGSTYHRAGCSILARFKVAPLHADDKDATAHGLKPCRICHRAKSEKKPAKNAWAAKKP